MARTVFANHRNFSHQGSSDKSLSSAPDVCNPPRGSASSSIPYPVTSQAADAGGYTTSVFIDGHPTAIASSIHTCCTGDEAGSDKGVISGTTSDKTEFISYSFDVRCEGEGVVRHQDMTMMNNGNTTGIVFGTETSAEIAEHSVEDNQGILIDFYITDYDDELRIYETTPGEKVWLNIRTRNLIGELATITLDEQEVAFKYQNKLLLNNTLTDYSITKNHEKIELDVVKQGGEFVDLYFTNTTGEIITEVMPGDAVLLNVETKNMIGEKATIDLNDEDVDFSYNGDRLNNDILSDYLIHQDIEKIPLEVIRQKTNKK